MLFINTDIFLRWTTLLDWRTLENILFFFDIQNFFEGAFSFAKKREVQIMFLNFFKVNLETCGEMLSFSCRVITNKYKLRLRQRLLAWFDFEEIMILSWWVRKAIGSHSIRLAIGISITAYYLSCLLAGFVYFMQELAISVRGTTPKGIVSGRNVTGHCKLVGLVPTVAI